MSELPDGWCVTRLDNLLTAVEAGRSFKCSERPAKPDEWGVIKVSAMTWRQFDEAENKAVLSDHHADPRFEIRSGDLLFSRANTVAYAGAVVQVGETRPRLLLSDKSLRLVPCRDVSPRWLLYYIRSQRARRYLESVATGTKDAMRNISQASLGNLLVPLAPLHEQQRIVAAIEEQFSHLDVGVVALGRVRQNLKRMRTALLREAVAVPAGTPSVYAKELFSWASGKRISKTDSNGDFPVFGGNGIAGRSQKFLKACETIVIGRVGALCGNVYLTNGPAWITDNAIYAQSHSERIFLPYAALVLRDARLRDRATGTGQPFVNQRILNEVVVPLPPNKNQVHAVSAYNAAEEALSYIEHQLGVLNQRQVRLRSSILSAAFSGKLVPQDPADEPVSALLERLAEERASSNGHKRGRARKLLTLQEKVTS